MMKTNLFRIIILSAVILGMANFVSAQGIYFGANVGYALKLSSETQVQITDAGNSTTYKAMNYSLGKGFDAGLMVGYMFNKNIGAELALSYLIGGKTTIKDEHENEGFTRTQEYIQKARMFRINPALVVAAGFEKIDPYAKFGVIVGFGSILNEYTETQGNDVYVEKRKDNGGVAFGLTAALGVDYNLSEMLAIFAEINMENMSYAPTKGKLTEATNNGSDLLPGMTTRDKEFEYVKEYTISSAPPESEPAKSSKYRYPFGSVGLNIGVKIRL